MNLRIVNNKNKEIWNSPKQQDSQTSSIVSETWINDKQNMPANFSTTKHCFIHGCRVEEVTVVTVTQVGHGCRVEE